MRISIKKLQSLIKETINENYNPLTKEELGILDKIANESLAIQHIARYAQRSQNEDILIKKLTQISFRLENIQHLYKFLKVKIEGQ